MNMQGFVKGKLRPVKREFHRKVRGIVSPNALFYVISHERSGTHFTINTLLRNTVIRPGYHYIRDWYGPYDSPVRFTHIDKFNSIWEIAYKQSAIIKSHCDRDLFEARYKKAKVIYVLRDPRDTLTSWFHYLNHDEYYRTNPTVTDHRCKDFSEFIRRPLSPILKYGFSLHGKSTNVVERWTSHVARWLNAPDTLVIRYEDLQQNQKSVLRHMCEFLDLRPRWRIRSVGLNDAPSILPRKGMIGDWKNIFSDSDEAFVRKAVEYADMDWSLLVND